MLLNRKLIGDAVDLCPTTVSIINLAIMRDCRVQGLNLALTAHDRVPSSPCINLFAVMFTIAGLKVTSKDIPDIRKQLEV